MPISPLPASPGRDPPSVVELFHGFLILGLTGFGGVLPLARRMMVEKRRWLDADEFTDLLGLCQFMPGGNIINMSVAVGLKFRGATGALAAILGLIAAPTVVVIALGALFDRFQDDPKVRHVFAGLAAAAAGLLLSMAAKVAWPLRVSPINCIIAAACVLAVAGLRLPLPPTMLALAPISIAMTWKAARP
ncbi:chromate transporter [Caulobacter sp. SSI4214]|uniref:chromate transporter n=1 Tax=Caulobacter sp. SSI4214 TaxID=2575739 RepID=UPI001F50FAE9|nr:chromate transporter [Caulobacter sp. SSI4214]